MSKGLIDRETVQRIIDTANIVEVVSDFVNLKRKGANYMGLCPFHNERTPSFSVSPSKGICKCFSCGKGGSPVNFLMELEQMTFNEALRWLAKKYHIEIQEREMSDDERREQTERQGMMEVNDFAMRHFEANMADTPDGREIGLAYFRERGINDWAIKRFHLGYALQKSTDLYEAAKAKGYNEKFLLDTGLCSKGDHGVYDRFRGRVIYPVFTMSGKVVAFGGRTLRTDKSVAKYVNSPESIIYSKSRELYGLYQAKQAIVKQDKCILVEGYMDVISMHQSGIENVVASSGTSLTDGQIRLIHRFTENVTVIYDSDAAGIKASLRGIDMLLAEGLNIKVLLLPEGDDPDSFAQSHSSTEVEEYIKANEVDFIHFKSRILLDDCADDPIKRSKAVGDIVRSIAAIPVELTRTIYIQQCSQRFGIDEGVLTRAVAADLAKRREQNAADRRRSAAVDSIKNGPGAAEADAAEAAALAAEEEADRLAARQSATPAPASQADHRAAMLAPRERELLRLVLKYGMLDLGQQFDEEGTPREFVKVIDFVADDLAADGIGFSNEVYLAIFNQALELRRSGWESAAAEFEKTAAARREEFVAAGIGEIRDTAQDMAEISIREKRLRQNADSLYADDIRGFALAFLEKHLASSPDDRVRRITTDLVIEKHQLSKIYFKNNTKVETEEDRLDQIVPQALIALKYDVARLNFYDIKQQISDIQSRPGYDLREVLELMGRQQKWQAFCASLAEHIGERVYEPLRLPRRK